MEAIAHRGLHNSHPENTVAAFRRAVEAGADGVELDVHATRDGVPVVHHDFVPRGVVEELGLMGRPIASLTLAQLLRVDVGEGHRIPTLEDVLAELSGRCTAYVEVKQPGIEKIVAKIILSSGTRSAVHSFDHRIVARFREESAGIARGLLQVSRVVDPAALLRSAEARDLWQAADLVDPELVEQVHDAGGRVLAWTANNPAAWNRLHSAGVDGICSDSVDDLVSWARALPKQ